jgi:hypothetical protein
VRCPILLLCVFCAFGQGTDPKPKVEEYDVHAGSRAAAVGAEFMVHSFSGDNQMFLVEDFLVVEVAMYPPKNAALKVTAADFRLRLNGKNPLLTVASPAFVASAMGRPEWRSGPQLEAGGGMGNTGVILGRPVPSQVPGGPPATTGPRPPRAPSPQDRSGIDKPEPVSATELLVRTALPEGVQRWPVAGFLYFPWKGKTKSIKSLELLYDDAVLKLR